jgi:hypothetical protein
MPVQFSPDNLTPALLAVLRNGTAGDNPFTQTPEVPEPWVSTVSDVFVPRKDPSPSLWQHYGFNPLGSLSHMFGSSALSSPVGPSRYDEAMGGLPEGDRYRLYIDRNRQAQGPDCFDIREPGYAKGMQEAFELVRNLVGKPLTVDSYQSIHDTAIHDVFDHTTSAYMDKGFSNGHAVYGLELTKVTTEARQEWETEKLIAVSPKWWRSNQEYLSCLRRRNYVFPSVKPKGDKDLMRRRLETILTQYDKGLVRAETDLDKKRVIARACRSLEIGHFFTDGNQRTVAFLVLNKMLIENQLQPVILPDPFVFDGYLSVDQLVEEIDKGQDIFKQYVK